MRWFAVLLTMYILVLNVLPAIGMLNESIDAGCCSVACSDYGQESSNSDSEDGECPDVCNPFMSCSTCVGFTFSDVSILISVNEPVLESIKHYSESLTRSVCHSVWHPPNMA